MAMINRVSGHPSPEPNAWIFGSLYFTWATRLFTITRKKNKRGEELEQEDLFDLPEYEHCGKLTAVFENRWNRYMDTADPTNINQKKAQVEFKWSLWKVVRRQLLIAGVYRLVNSIVQLASPFVINELLLYVANVNDAPIYEGLFWAMMLGVINLLKAVIEGKFFWVVFRAGWQARSVVSTAVYKKSLRLSVSSRQTLSQGKIMNLMQLDAENLERYAFFFHVFWDAVFQIVAYCAILYFYIQEGVFVGLGVLVISLPLQGFIVFKLFQYQQKIVVFTDQRVKATNEALLSMLAVKMAAWEENFLKKISGFREKELKIYRQSLLLRAFITGFITSVPTFTAVAGLTYYGFQVETVEAALLFASLQAFTSLRFPLFQIPLAISTYTAAKVSQARLAKFLSLEENVQMKHSSDLLEKSDLDEKKQLGDPTIAVKISDGEYYWSKLGVQKAKASPVAHQGNGDAENGSVLNAEVVTSIPAMVDVNIEIKKGSLVGIVGAVGSGKSTLLNALLGELVQTKGSSTVNGDVAYASQTAWILNMTLRDNIVFGAEFNEERYKNVINACQLGHDLKLLQNGDQTVIGERGINLSGGQAQRVSVARTAYNASDIVVLDDPLSALDPEVANRLFNECILNFMSGRTRIMVTNQLTFLEKCDYVISLAGEHDDKSQGEEQKQLQVNGGRENGVQGEEARAANEPARIAEQGTFGDLMKNDADFAKLLKKYKGQEEKEEEKYKRQKSTGGDGADDKKNVAEELMQVEERAHGAVRLREYWSYIRAGGICFFFLAFFLLVLGQLSSIGNTFVVSFWSDDPFYEKRPLEFYLSAYAISAVVMGVLFFVQTYFFFLLGLRASRSLHLKVADGVFRAPMSFFDTTPTGRIVARFSRDIFAIDTEVPQNFSFFFLSVLFVVFSMITVATQLAIFLVMFPVLGIIYGLLVSYYRPTARDCKRLESITRSPVYAHFGETLSGLSSIRSYGAVGSFVEKNERLIDNSLRATYCVKVVERWLGVRLESLSAIIAMSAALFVVYAASEQGLTPGFAGIAISMVLTLTGLLGQTLRSFVQLETGMNAVERINYYANTIEREADYTSENPPDESWPPVGQVVLKDVTMRYRPETPLVLKGVNVTIPGGTTCGVVGRTGSGKSSLFLTLLRIVEREGGQIIVDGLDTSTIGLHELRKKISIVPQSPVMFSGTIQTNLDPFGLHSPEALWNALKQVNLEQHIRSLADELNSEVAEYGENFSQGQRQLICMARSLLAQAKVLLLDEATSSVDYETDALIQSTIRESFKSCTILTIAHRVQTIIDNDNILVMAAGKAEEFGKPADLLRVQDSEFSKVIAELGPQVEANIRNTLLGN